MLGSTGSVGTNVLRIVDAFPGRFEVVGLAGGGNVERLAEQVARYRPRVVSVATAEARDNLARLVDLSGLSAGVGREGMVEVATHADARVVVASAVGAVGLAQHLGKDLPSLALKRPDAPQGMQDLIERDGSDRGDSLAPC